VVLREGPSRISTETSQENGRISI